ncbi:MULTISPECIES: transaldolase family protein [Roseobacteraceae]|uniref:Transaldolase n=1 Tax=Pseudosulfitobacter pseudonitzschiae TaxID=1402135 RepID=A0A221JWL8_9RHOB|nr:MULTISPECIES: transaldolase family protein [Roseobacteraceae]ASM71124.1 transaldolase [Pseudosulfitobacter pseudonitzschiae]
MALYLDTADLNAWDALMPTGLFHGITTNPLLAARAGLDYPAIDWAQIATRARDLGAKELHAQVYGPVESYIDWAGRLYDAGRMAGIETVVKIPLVEPAVRVTGAIRALGGRVLMTACYDPKQMFVANALGADFIAPYFGRMDAAGMDAYGALAQMKAIQGTGEKRCTILVASLRSPEQMVQLAAEGQDTFTISPAVAQALLDDANSAAAYAEFEATVAG